MTEVDVIVSSQSCPDGSTLDTDVCIVGAGPAGIAMALELDASSLRVCLLESGGLEPDARAQSLATDAGEPTGDLGYPRASETRFVAFGGTATGWGIAVGGGRQGVRYVPLDPIDFERRDWVPHSGWPITRRELDPYYARAHVVAGAGRYDYEPSRWQTDSAREIAFPGGRARTQLFHFGPRDVFTTEARRTLDRSRNVTVMTDATALALDTDRIGTSVSGVRVGSLAGHRFEVRAKIVILAVGGLETPRLLMLSNRVRAQGVGNDHDLVGRFLMDHQGVTSGFLIPPDRRLIDTLGFYDTRFVDGAMVTGKVVLTEETLRRERLLNICAALFPRTTRERLSALRALLPHGPRFRSPAVASAIAVKRAIRQRRLPEGWSTHVARIASGLDDLMYYQARKAYGRRRIRTFHFDHGGWSRLEEPSKRFSCLEVVHLVEQSPSPSNRVTLGDERDTFGRRKLQIHWQLNDGDLHSIRRAQSVLAEELAAAGLGPLHLQLDRQMPQVFSGSLHHPMGTARMHAEPTQGVVDANCRVHGTSNLYVAGSAVFPTGGYANPTLTILALALRLADHVKDRVSQHTLVAA